MPKKKSLRVMEYLREPGAGVIGYALLDAAEYRRWQKQPRSRTHRVTAFCVIGGAEEFAEMGTVECARLFDYFHTLPAIPDDRPNCAELERRFTVAADHPTLGARDEDSE
jgi:hypothetical protein